MSRNHKMISPGNSIAALLILCTGIILQAAYLENRKLYWLLLLAVPLLLLFKRKEKNS